MSFPFATRFDPMYLPFEVLEILGAGGMSQVFRVKCRETGIISVAKFLSPALRENTVLMNRFEREIKVLRTIRHAHIVQYLSDGTAGPYRYYTMELMRGGTIADLLHRYGRLPLERVLDYGIQLCRALEYIHEQNIIHRDLKPANLFLTETGHLKLGDFGIIYCQDANRLSEAGRTAGTSAYMAPEQITGGQNLTPRSDLYAFGCMLFELLTMRTPFQADSLFEMYRFHLDKEPPRLREFVPDCSRDLENVVMQLLKKKPAERPASARAVRVVLTELQSQLTREAQRRISLAETPQPSPVAASSTADGADRPVLQFVHAKPHLSDTDPYQPGALQNVQQLLANLGQPSEHELSEADDTRTVPVTPTSEGLKRERDSLPRAATGKRPLVSPFRNRKRPRCLESSGDHPAAG